MSKLKRNPARMSKAGEKNLYREFILATPEDSYLRDVLTDSRDFVFGNIDNDIAWPMSEHARQYDRDVRDSLEKLKKLKAEIRGAKAELNKVEGEVRYAKRQNARVLDTTRKFLDSIANETSIVRNELNSERLKGFAA